MGILGNNVNSDLKERKWNKICGLIQNCNSFTKLSVSNKNWPGKINDGLRPGENQDYNYQILITNAIHNSEVNNQ